MKHIHWRDLTYVATNSAMYTSIKGCSLPVFVSYMDPNPNPNPNFIKLIFMSEAG